MEIVWAVECEEKEISNFVASKACKKIYAFKPNDGTQSLRKHNCSENRGLRVYPYLRPRVYIPDPTLGRTTTGSTGNGYTHGSGSKNCLPADP